MDGASDAARTTVVVVERCCAGSGALMPKRVAARCPECRWPSRCVDGEVEEHPARVETRTAA